MFYYCLLLLPGWSPFVVSSPHLPPTHTSRIFIYLLSTCILIYYLNIISMSSHVGDSVCTLPPGAGRSSSTLGQCPQTYLYYVDQNPTHRSQKDIFLLGHLGSNTHSAGGRDPDGSTCHAGPRYFAMVSLIGLAPSGIMHSSFPLLMSWVHCYTPVKWLSLFQNHPLLIITTPHFQYKWVLWQLVSIFPSPGNIKVVSYHMMIACTGPETGVFFLWQPCIHLCSHYTLRDLYSSFSPLSYTVYRSTYHLSNSPCEEEFGLTPFLGVLVTTGLDKMG